MFEIISTEQLIEKVKAFKFTRKILQLHIHHTYSPSHEDYNGSNGLKLQEAMKTFHVQTRKFQDIAQHLTLLPDGQWVTGRDWNIDPASITGWNQGAFAVEMLGNFDKGFDTFGGKQAEAMFRFAAFFMPFMKLDVDKDLKFHRDSPTAGKTCPGTSIDKAWFISQVKTPATPLETVMFLKDKGILTNESYWLKKALSDSDTYQLMKNMVSYIKKG